MEDCRSFVNADFSAPAAEFAIQPPPKKSKISSTKAQENLDAATPPKKPQMVTSDALLIFIAGILGEFCLPNNTAKIKLRKGLFHTFLSHRSHSQTAKHQRLRPSASGSNMETKELKRRLHAEQMHLCQEDLRQCQKLTRSGSSSCSLGTTLTRTSQALPGTPLLRRILWARLLWNMINLQ